MDWLLSMFESPREFGAAALVSVTIIAIITGRLVPWWQHKQVVKASEKKDVAIQALLEQNSRLVAGIRIADKFYSDFLPTPNETQGSHNVES